MGMYICILFQSLSFKIKKHTPHSKRSDTTNNKIQLRISGEMYRWHSLLVFKSSYLHKDTIYILQGKNTLPCTARHLRVEIKMIFHNI